MSKYKRNGHLVRSPVQRALLQRFLFHWGLLAGLFLSLLVGFHLLLGSSADRQSSVFQEIWQHYSLVIVLTLGLVPYFLFDLIRLTHRFAGPLVRLGDVLHRAAEGQAVEPINYRTNDWGHELACDLNKILERLRNLEGVAALKALEVKNGESNVDEMSELVKT